MLVICVLWVYVCVFASFIRFFVWVLDNLGGLLGANRMHLELLGRSRTRSSIFERLICNEMQT